MEIAFTVPWEHGDHFKNLAVLVSAKRPCGGVVGPVVILSCPPICPSAGVTYVFIGVFFAQPV